MALVFKLKAGEDFYVGDERFVVVDIQDETHFRLRRVSTGEEFQIADDPATEVLPEVRVFGGRRAPRARLVFRLPNGVTVRRGS